MPLIVRIRDRQELFDEACRIAIDHGNFRMAWIGLVDREAMLVKPVAWHGTDAEYIHLMPLGWSTPNPTGAAWRVGRQGTHGDHRRRYDAGSAHPVEEGKLSSVGSVLWSCFRC